MSELIFSKVLTANDVGETLSHQAGIHIPKSMPELLSFLPELGQDVFNPSVWIKCRDEYDEIWTFRYVYYNNKFHSLNGRRNEYRLTHMTKFLKYNSSVAGDSFVITKREKDYEYRIRVVPQTMNPLQKTIKLVGWNREY